MTLCKRCPRAHFTANVMRLASNKTALIVAGVGIAAIWFAMNASLQYSGDGVLRNYGWTDANHRYVLDLGAVDLRKNGSYAFRVGSLPQKEFVLGIEVTLSAPQPNIGDKKPLSGRARFVLRDSAGANVIFEDAALRDWTWNVPSTGEWMFLYRKPLETTGTFVLPKNGEHYDLTVDITAGEDRNLAYTAKVIGRTSGWK